MSDENPNVRAWHPDESGQEQTASVHFAVPDSNAGRPVPDEEMETFLKKWERRAAETRLSQRP
jgi:hypothetical protein